MVDPLSTIGSRKHREALAALRDLMGTVKTSRDLRDMVPGFRTQKGIYKPGDSSYALWIRHTEKGTYEDSGLNVQPDGSWSYRYMPEARNGKTDMSLSTNRALLNCMKDRVPVAVFLQKNVPDLERSYEIMGLAYIEGFDGTHFTVRGEAIDVDAVPMDNEEPSPFQPFETGPPDLSVAVRRLREIRFGIAVKRAYHERCSLCELGYRFHGEAIAVEAAHVIPVADRGTSKDIRNGILLCRNHHSLFDRNLWTFDEDLRVIVSEDEYFRKSAANNCVLRTEGRKLPNLPENHYDRPATEAIRFRLDRFYKADAPKV